MDNVGFFQIMSVKKNEEMQHSNINSLSYLSIYLSVSVFVPVSGLHSIPYDLEPNVGLKGPCGICGLFFLSFKLPVTIFFT